MNGLGLLWEEEANAYLFGYFHAQQWLKLSWYRRLKRGCELLSAKHLIFFPFKCFLIVPNSLLSGSKPFLEIFSSFSKTGIMASLLYGALKKHNASPTTDNGAEGTIVLEPLHTKEKTWGTRLTFLSHLYPRRILKVVSRTAKGQKTA